MQIDRGLLSYYKLHELAPNHSKALFKVGRTSQQIWESTDQRFDRSQSLELLLFYFLADLNNKVPKEHISILMKKIEAQALNPNEVPDLDMNIVLEPDEQIMFRNSYQQGKAHEIMPEIGTLDWSRNGLIKTIFDMSIGNPADSIDTQLSNKKKEPFFNKEMLDLKQKDKLDEVIVHTSLSKGVPASLLGLQSMLEMGLEPSDIFRQGYLLYSRRYLDYIAKYFTG